MPASVSHRALPPRDCVAFIAPRESMPHGGGQRRSSPGWPTPACWPDAGRLRRRAGSCRSARAPPSMPTTGTYPSCSRRPRRTTVRARCPRFEPSVAAPPRYTSRRPPAPGAEYSPGSMPILSRAHPRSSNAPVKRAICGMSPSARDRGRRSVPSGTALIAQLCAMSPYTVRRHPARERRAKCAHANQRRPLAVHPVNVASVDGSVPSRSRLSVTLPAEHRPSPG